MVEIRTLVEVPFRGTGKEAQSAMHLPSLFKVVSKLLFTVSYGLISYLAHFTAQYG